MTRKTHFPVTSCFHIFHNTSQLQMTFCYEMLNLLCNVFFYTVADFLECSVLHFMTCKFSRHSFLREINTNFMESFTSKCLFYKTLCFFDDCTSEGTRLPTQVFIFPLKLVLRCWKSATESQSLKRLKN